MMEKTLIYLAQTAITSRINAQHAASNVEFYVSETGWSLNSALVEAKTARDAGYVAEESAKVAEKLIATLPSPSEKERYYADIVKWEAHSTAMSVAYVNRMVVTAQSK